MAQNPQRVPRREVPFLSLDCMALLCLSQGMLESFCFSFFTRDRERLHFILLKVNGLDKCPCLKTETPRAYWPVWQDHEDISLNPAVHADPKRDHIENPKEGRHDVCPNLAAVPGRGAQGSENCGGPIFPNFERTLSRDEEHGPACTPHPTIQMLYNVNYY